MRTSLNLTLEPELMDAFAVLSREQGTTVAHLIDLALKEFIFNMEDQLEMCHMKRGNVRAPGLA